MYRAITVISEGDIVIQHHMGQNGSRYVAKIRMEIGKPLAVLKNLGVKIPKDDLAEDFFEISL